MNEDFGTNWYDRDVVIVKLGKFLTESLEPEELVNINSDENLYSIDLS